MKNMKLKDFVVVYNVHAPYYLCELKNGVGTKLLIHTDDFISSPKRLNSVVIGLGVSHHSFLGALLEVDIDAL